MAKWREPYSGTVEVIEIRGNGKCIAGLKVGDIFTFEEIAKSGFCFAAYQCLYPSILALKYGAELPWEQDGSTARICCSDPDCTVVFFLKRQKVKELEINES